MVNEEKWDALRIAAWFERGLGGCEAEAAAELRRLHEVNQEMLEVLKDYHVFAASDYLYARRVLAAIAKATGEQT